METLDKLNQKTCQTLKSCVEDFLAKVSQLLARDWGLMIQGERFL